MLFRSFDALRPVGQVTADMSCGSWTLNTGLGWDGTQISAVQGQAPRLATEDRLIGEVVLTGESAASSVSLSFERFNDRPFVAHLSVVFAGEVAVETEVASFVRLGTVSGVRTDEMVADDPWRTTRLHGSVYGAVDLSPNLVSTVRFDGSWRDLDPFDRLPVSRVAATVGLTGKI